MPERPRVTLALDGGQEHVTAVANSAGVVNALFKVHDRFEAFFDPHTFCSLRVSKNTEEGLARARPNYVSITLATRACSMKRI